MNKRKHRKTKPHKQATARAARTAQAALPPPDWHNLTGLYATAVAVALLAGALLRLLYLDQTLGGMQADEASVGYEAWSLLHYGIDRNGYAWPVHFVAWGGGQSVLYSYLSLPIIAALDLTIFSTRLLMALAGVASLLLFWRVAARAHPTFALLALLMLAVCPWHLMISRWAYECNLLPFVILLSVYFFTRKDNDRPGIQAAGVFVLSMSVYAYSSAYFFAPLFLALVFGWLRAQGKLPLPRLLLLSALSLLTTLPILLFLAVNFFDWEAIRAGISMPRFTGTARYEQKSTLFDGRFFSHLGGQLLSVVKLLSVSNPAIPINLQNKMPGFTVLFPMAIAPLALGFGATLYRAVKARDFGVHLLMALWLIAALATVSVTEFLIHRANVLWLPALYFTALGVFYACQKWRVLLPVAAAATLLYGGWFAHAYFTQYSAQWPYHNPGAAIAGLSERAGPAEKIYITRQLHEPYIHALFHTQTPPHDYLATRNIPEPDTPFQKVESFGRFIFTPERIREADHFILRRNNAGQIILHPDEAPALNTIDLTHCDAGQHGRFAALYCN